VLWICDFMYGNGFEFFLGYKIWWFDDIIEEFCGFFEVYKVFGMVLGGVYFELIGFDVIECFGGYE